MTYGEYLSLPEGPGYNLLGGFLCREPAPAVSHQVVVDNIVALLRAYARSAGAGARGLREINVHLDEANAPVPDVCFISADRARSLERRGMEGIAPDLCVEVLSPSSAARDRGVKAELYARHGCREYWIVDPEHLRVEVFAAAGQGGFAPAGAYGLRDSFVSAVCAGLRVDVDAVFAEA